MTYIDNNIDRFTKVRISRYKMIVRNDLFDHDFLSLLPIDNTLDGVRNDSPPYYESDYAKVYKRDISFKGRRLSVYIKHYLKRRFDCIKALIRGTRAKRALDAAILLEKNNFKSPKVIAMGQLKCGPFFTRNFLITHDLKNAKDIFETFRSIQSNQSPENTRQKRLLIKQLAATVGRLHNKNIYHGDLRLGNVFAEKKQDSWEFYFLDNERTGKPMPFYAEHLRIKNLVQVNMFNEPELTRTDRARFYKYYLAENPHLMSRKKLIANKVAIKTARRLAPKN